MNDDTFITASCYLDGELSDDERRHAEADPDVMAEVARMRALQVRMQQVPMPVSADEIDRRISAAFTQVQQTPTTEPHPTSTTAKTTPNPAPTGQAGAGWSRALAVAAAVVGLGIVGVVIANYANQSDAESASAPATSLASSEATAVELAADTTSNDAMVESDSAMAADSEEMADATMAATADSMADSAVAGEMAATTAPAAGGFAARDYADPYLVGVDELRDYTRDLLTNVAPAELPFPDDVTCTPPDDSDGNPLTIVASGTFQNATNAETTPIFIAVQIDATTTPRSFTSYALDQKECSEIVFAEGFLTG